MKQPEHIRRVIILCFWLAVWQIASLLIGNPIVFVGPAAVVRSFSVLILQKFFWESIVHTLTKISLGFFNGFVMGILFGSLAYRFRWIKDFLEPIMLLIKSVPVASFVILALIWFGSKNLSILISFLVVFPIIYINTIAGLESTDPHLLEMAQVFLISPAKRIHYIYIPAFLPYLTSGCKAALGMSWKSGIAAEVIGVPTRTIGENLYLAKIYLDTSDLFAWTIVIIAASTLFEKLFLKILELFGTKRFL